MTGLTSKSIATSTGGLLAAMLIATVAAAPASAHQPFYYYEVHAQASYQGEDARLDAKTLYGETPQWVSVGDALGQANTINGGTVSGAAEVHPIDPYALTYQTHAGASGFLSYNVWIDGPDPDALVPVRFIASGSVSANNVHASGEARLRFLSVGVGEGPGAVHDQWYVNGAGKEEYLDGISQLVAFFDVDRIYYLKPSITYNVEMYAGAGAFSAGDQNSRASATVDPVFTILGDFAANYRVVGVPGSTGGAVPEPASWAMMIAGFGLAGAAMRRRVRVAMAAA